MRPYYDHKGIKIYHGDCRDILPHLGIVDLILTDPPFNANKKYGSGTNDLMSWPAYCEWLCPIITQMEQMCSGPVMIFASVNGMLELCRIKRPKHICVWDKPLSFAPRLGNSTFMPHWEPCLIYGNIYGNQRGESGRQTYHISDVWHNNPAERNGHPCPKPLPLLKRIIRDIPAILILDPFMGSGTTLVAAKQLNSRAIGIEIEERYCEIAAIRLSQEVLDFGDQLPPQLEQADLYADEEPLPISGEP
ncbi:MAG: hypothetical protein A2W35_06635 [Chloroflexi bacterium RBG_16_57_11]|nr:MAG: hypothetical protein A2W35_06635 [Chloroflexi bacterium RBG_16_57_11]